MFEGKKKGGMRGLVDTGYEAFLPLLSFVGNNKALMAILVSGGFLFKDYFTNEGLDFILKNKDNFTNKEYAINLAKCAMDSKSVSLESMKKCSDSNYPVPNNLQGN